MSDVSQGPGWWQASDGKWYPPEQRPADPAPTATQTGGYQTGGYQAGAAQTGGYQADPAAGQYPVGSGPGPLADWGTRVLATLIDGGILLALVVAGVILAAILGVISTTLGLLVGILIYLVAIAGSFYFYYMNGATGQTPGKKILGIKVVSEETGQVIGGGLGIVRGLAHFLDGFFFIGYLFPLWDPKRQTFADKIMKTVVLSGLPKQALSPDLLKT